MAYTEQIIRSTQHLAGLIRAGRFIYKYDANGRKVLPGYNMLRHSGAIWSIHQAIEAGIAPPTLAATTLQGLAWLTEKQIDRRKSGALFVFGGNRVKLGANGLALLALTTARHLTDAITAQVIEGLGRYILEERRADHDFHHTRCRMTEAVLDFRSNYYTGEALFGLIMAGTNIERSDFIDVAESSVHTLVMGGYGIKEHSHWMMHAVNALHKIRPHPFLTDYALRLGQEIMSDADYRNRGTCTPVACRTEALLSIEELLRRSGAGNSGFRKSVQSTIEENIKIQLQSACPNGAFRRSPKETIVRIDYIQHNLSCLIGYNILYT